MMIEKSAKKQRKGSIGEHDVAAILEKYSATTILAMFHEIAQVAEASKIDWNALVEKTSTGISSAREYQMLWRHFAYRDDLFENLGDDAQPLDDDSDLEFELEAFPSVSGEASAEAAACVKVMIASGAPTNDSNPNGSTIEAPLTVNIPNSLSSGDLDQPSCSMQGTNITVPVSVQKQPATSSSVQVAEGTVANGSNGGINFNKRKRKPWTEAEDLELIAAVQKYGEGNWANILRGDFKGDRTASQLSQRWVIIRKRNGGNVNLGDKSNGSQLTESQLATRKAIYAALDGGQGKTLTSNTLSNGGTTTVVNRPAGTSSISNFVKPNVTNNSSVAAETSTGGNNNLPQPHKPVQETAVPKPPPVAPTAPVTKSRALPPVKKTVVKPTPTSSSDARVRATAVAAGARIASPSDAASLLKAAQGKNAIHIIPSAAGGSVKPATTGGVSEANPNVHYIRTGLANAPISNYAPVKPVAPVTRHLPAVNGLSCKQSSEVKTTGEAKAPESGSASKEEIQVNGTHVSSPVLDAESKSSFGAENPVSSSNLKTGEKDRQVIIRIEPKKAADVASTNGRLVPQQKNKMEEDRTSVVNDAEKSCVNQNSDKGGEKNNGNRNTDKVADLLPSVVAGVGKNGEIQNVNKMAAAPESAVADGEKTGEDGTIDKMEIDRC